MIAYLLTSPTVGRKLSFCGSIDGPQDNMNSPHRPPVNTKWLFTTPGTIDISLGEETALDFNLIPASRADFIAVRKSLPRKASKICPRY
jgi:hypothetical protein